MTIAKALFLTLLHLAIYALLAFLMLRFHVVIGINSEVMPDHLGAVIIISQVTSYMIVFHFLWKPRPDLRSAFKYVKSAQTIPCLILIAIGYGFGTQPIIDFNRILDYYLHSEIRPQSLEFHGFSNGFIYRSVSSLLIAPMFEELFFRKFLFSSLLQKNKKWVAIFVSSLCFAAIHFETPNNLVPPFIFGIIACLLYLRTNSILPLILLHFSINLQSVLFEIYGEPYFDWIYGLNYNFVYRALFIFGILVTVFGVSQIKKRVITIESSRVNELH